MFIKFRQNIRPSTRIWKLKKIMNHTLYRKNFIEYKVERQMQILIIKKFNISLTSERDKIVQVIFSELSPCHIWAYIAIVFTQWHSRQYFNTEDHTLTQWTLVMHNRPYVHVRRSLSKWALLWHSGHLQLWLNFTIHRFIK